MKNYLILVVVLILSACTGSGDVPESEKTLPVKFNVAEGAYMAVQTLGGWKKITEGKETKINVSGTSFFVVKACSSYGVVRVFRVDSKKHEDGVSHACPTINQVLDDLVNNANNEHILPVGSVNEDVGFRLINIDGGTLDKPNYVSLSAVLGTAGETGRFFWDIKSTLDEIKKSKIDFTSATNVVEFTEKYSFPITYPSDSIKSVLIEGENSNVSAQIESKSIGYFAPQKLAGEIKIPKLMIDGKSVSANTSIGNSWDRVADGLGGRVTIRQSQTPDFGVGDKINYELKGVPEFPEKHSYRFENETLVSVFKGYHSGIDRMVEHSPNFFLVVKADGKTTKWSLSDYLVKDISKDI